MLSLLACVSGPPSKSLPLGVNPGVGEWAGIEIHADKINAAVIEPVVNQINRNECRLPKHLRLVRVEGSWSMGPPQLDARGGKVRRKARRRQSR